VSDPALDFAGFDAPLRRELLAGYALPVDETLEERAAAYRDKISPFHAVLYGLTIDDRSWVERGVAALEAAHAG
jgi:hypothetical protein